MKRILRTMCAIMALMGAQTVVAQNSRMAIAERKAQNALSQMTLDEKLDLIDGNSFDIKPNERLGLKKVHMYDGPLGVRGTTASNASYPSTVAGAIAERLAPSNSTAYPAAVMLAATWNRRLAHDYGYALGQDSRARGVNIILGPAVNIYRSPRNSRNFEYMGEDPYLSAQMGGQYIIGVQENPGVIACIKHFAANNPESGRYDVSSDVDERTLQEIYLPAFRYAVEQCNVGSIMSSYNRINGTWTSENQWLMHDVLRGQWKFPFLSMTDWGAAHHTDMIVKYGVDLEMPGGSVMTAKKIKPLLEKGEVSIEDIDQKVLNILRTCYYFRLYEYSDPDLTIPLDNKESAKTAYEVAKEGFVLLKNEDKILPIDKSRVRRICVTGHNALDYVSGGGSSIVTPFRKVSAFEAIQAEAKKQGVNVEYRELEQNPSVVSSVCYADAQLKKHGISAEYFKGISLSGTPFVKRVEPKVASPWLARPLGDFNIEDNFSARFQTWVKVNESGQYLVSVSGDDGFRLDFDGQRLVDDWNSGTARLHVKEVHLEAGRVYPAVVEYFQNGGGCSVDFNVQRVDANGRKRVAEELKAYDLVIVCEGFDKNLEAEGGDRTFALNDDRESVLEMAAQSGVPTVAVINAGGNVESQQWQPYVKGLIWAWYAGQEGNRALADILFGNVNPSGKLPMTFECRAEDNPAYLTYSDQGGKHTHWTEGIFVGYRGYDRKGIKPLYPFGFGLSYTSFSLSDLNVELQGDVVSVKVRVANTGECDGAEVVQVYVGKQEASPVIRPAKELKQFEKVELRAGEAKTVTLSIPVDAFQYYDVNTHQFVDDPGRWAIFVGTSSKDVPLIARVKI